MIIAVSGCMFVSLSLSLSLCVCLLSASIINSLVANQMGATKLGLEVDRDAGTCVCVSGVTKVKSQSHRDV